MAVKSILIYGSARSGTTWVQDVLAQSNRYGTFFEPLHPDAVKGAEQFANLYMRPGTIHDELKIFMDSVVSGQLRSMWASVRARPDRVFPPLSDLFTRSGANRTRSIYIASFRRWRKNREFKGRPKVIKFVRANLLVDWMWTEYGLKSAFVVRHPCAVLSSICQRSGEEWGRQAFSLLLNRYIEQSNLVEDRLQDKLDGLRGLRSIAEIHAAIWCIENAELIAAGDKDGRQIVCYESLVAGEEPVWRQLTESLGLSVVPDAELRMRPSQQARYGIGKKVSELEQISMWQDVLTQEQIADVQRILDIFEVNLYSTDHTLPTRELRSN